MESKDLLNYINKPELLDEKSLENLLKILIKYPYFQTGHMLFLRNLKNINSPEIDVQKAYRAIHVADRKMLFKLMNKGLSIIEEPRKEKQKEQVNVEAKKVQQKDLSFSEDSLNFHQSVVQELYFKPVEPEDKKVEKEEKKAPEIEEKKVEKVPEKKQIEQEKKETVISEEKKGKKTDSILTAADLIRQSKKGELGGTKKTLENVSISKEILNKVNELRRENKEVFRTQQKESDKEPIKKEIVSDKIIEPKKEVKIELKAPLKEEKNKTNEPIKEILKEKKLEEKQKIEPAKESKVEKKEQLSEVKKNPELEKETKEVLAKKMEQPQKELESEKLGENTQIKPEKIENTKENIELPDVKQITEKEPENKKEKKEQESKSKAQTAADAVFKRIAELRKKQEQNKKTENTASNKKEEDTKVEKLEEKISTTTKKAENQATEIVKETIKTSDSPVVKEETKNVAPKTQETEIHKKPVVKKIKKKTDLINKFIKDSPSVVSNKKEVSQQDVSSESIVERDTFMTEKMAKIYVLQGYFEKAIDVYEKLILKYPKKKAYFADQIVEVKKKLATK